jgi:hypothetical protein
MSASANGWQGVPSEASDEQQTGRLLEEGNEEWRPMPPVPLGLLPCNAYAAIALTGPRPAEVRSAAAVDHAGAALARFAAHLAFSDIPAPVFRRTGDLLLDWFGSALGIRTVAGRTPGCTPQPNVPALQQTAGFEGRSQCFRLPGRSQTAIMFDGLQAAAARGRRSARIRR